VALDGESEVDMNQMLNPATANVTVTMMSAFPSLRLCSMTMLACPHHIPTLHSEIRVLKAQDEQGAAQGVWRHQGRQVGPCHSLYSVSPEWQLHFGRQ